MSNFKWFGKAALVVAGLAAFVSSAQATLVIDIRPVGSVNDGSTAPESVPAVPGTTMNFSVYAVVTGADQTATNDGFQAVHGSILSQTGGQLANIVGLVNTGDHSGGATGFNGSSAQDTAGGFNQNAAATTALADLDADTDIDVGNTAGGTATAGIWLPRSASMTTAGTAVTYNGAVGQEFLIGTLSVAVPAADTGDITLNFLLQSANIGNATFQVDGSPKNGTVGSGGTITSDGLIITAPVPEPASLALIGLGAIGLVVARRRRIA